MLGRGNSIGASEMVNRPGSLEHFCSIGLAQPARRRMTRPASTAVGSIPRGPSFVRTACSSAARMALGPTSGAATAKLRKRRGPGAATGTSRRRSSLVAEHSLEAGGPVKKYAHELQAKSDRGIPRGRAAYALLRFLVRRTHVAQAAGPGRIRPPVSRTIAGADRRADCRQGRVGPGARSAGSLDPTIGPLGRNDRWYGDTPAKVS